MWRMCAIDFFELEHIVYQGYLLIVVALSAVITTRFVYITGLRPSRVRRLLEEASKLSGTKNHSSLSACLSKLPARCPERRLREWAIEDAPGPLALALDRSSERFDLEMSRLSTLVSTLSFLLGLTILISLTLFIKELHGVLLGASSEKHPPPWLVTELLACVVAPLGPGLWVITCIYFVEGLLNRTISRRREFWKHFRVQATASPATGAR